MCTRHPARHAFLLAVLLWSVLLPVPAHAGAVLDAVRQRGLVHCGVNAILLGFSAQDERGQWSGLDVDICRAIAAAVLQDADKVRYVTATSARRFTALRDGEVDLLTLNSTITLSREVGMGVRMTAVSYYDGQGFIVPVKSRMRSALQLKGKSVCIQAGSTSVANLNDYSNTHKLGIKPMLFGTYDEATTAYFAGRCAAYTSDAAILASIRLQKAADPLAHTILPELIAKEPLGPIVRRDDDAWAAIVMWTLHGLIEAEEFGVTQANVDEMRKSSTKPAVQRLLGVSEDTGRALGLDRDWLVRAIRASGNYGEIFERNLGPRTPLGIVRGLNHQWNRGGLHYGLPVR